MQLAPSKKNPDLLFSNYFSLLALFSCSTQISNQAKAGTKGTIAFLFHCRERVRRAKGMLLIICPFSRYESKLNGTATLHSVFQSRSIQHGKAVCGGSTALAHQSEGRELLPGKTGSYWASQRVQLMWVLIWGQNIAPQTHSHFHVLPTHLSPMLDSQCN